MKQEITFDTLTSNQVDLILKLCPPQTYNIETEIVYEGQTPRAGYLIINGSISFYKRKKLIKTLGKNSLFGIFEVMNNACLEQTAIIAPGSKVCILHKSVIKELMEDSENFDLPAGFNLIA